jgi:hypothetical protein
MLIASEATKRNTSIIIATLFFGIFGVLAIMAGVLDLMNPIYPWGHRLPMLGELALAVGVLSLVATGLLWKLRRLGGYLGIVSFGVAFAVNMYVGEHLILHVIAGVLAGLVLFVPLAFGWKSLSSSYI